MRSFIVAFGALVVLSSSLIGCEHESRRDARYAERRGSFRGSTDGEGDPCPCVAGSSDGAAQGGDADRARPANDEELEGPAWHPPRRTLYQSTDSFNSEHTVERVRAAGRPPTKGFIDVDLKSAAVADALRFIANAGGFNLVVEGDPVTAVTVELHHVDAYDALVAVAEAQGLEVDYSRGIVRVGPAKPASASNTPSP